MFSYCWSDFNLNCWIEWKRKRFRGHRKKPGLVLWNDCSREHAGPVLITDNVVLQWTELPFEIDITWPPAAKLIPPSQGILLWFICTRYHLRPLPTHSLKLLSTSVWALCENQSGMQHSSVHFHLNLLPSKEKKIFVPVWEVLFFFFFQKHFQD